MKKKALIICKKTTVKLNTIIGIIHFIEKEKVPIQKVNLQGR